jgi:transposase
MIDPLLPEPLGLVSCRVQIGHNSIVILAGTTAPSALCPACGCSSSRVHSHYARHLADLPWHGRPVRVVLTVRRFFCDAVACQRRIFAERVPAVAAARARQTGRLAQALTGIAFACGGEGGARLALRLGMPTSPDTLLRRIRRTVLAPRRSPRVLGVDDWAVRRGARYGTILCDLEQHRAIDLLNERSATSLAEWLADRPEVEIISRDRAGCYAQGATTGAPGAQQVADRWHLLHNVREALIRLLDRRHAAVREAARVVAARQFPRAPPRAPETHAPPSPPVPAPTQQLSHTRRAQRLKRYERVRELHCQGYSQRAIARQLNLNRETVARYLRVESFPERATRPYPTCVDAFAEYLQQRWHQGCWNAAQLTRELAARGFRGSYCAVQRYVSRWLRSVPTEPSPVPVVSPSSRAPSAKRVAAWLLTPDAQLQPEALVFVDALTRANPDITVAGLLAQEFGELIRQRRAAELDDWIMRAVASHVPRELRVFAKGLRSDCAAVRAALSSEWSNGQVEGQVNRVKLIKRQMYGRAKFDLLRQRVLYRG